ncbi:uncharacterized protein BROUX77_005581 [Berkeleyomyces rouxiae]|uniref:uncharacterized protein n=1 Tax=Berkeleyomyces rouxiae TaxID=2035830 RepID=UPI003B7880F3
MSSRRSRPTLQKRQRCALAAIVVALRQNAVDDVGALETGLVQDGLCSFMIPVAGPPATGTAALAGLQTILELSKSRAAASPGLLSAVLAYTDPRDDWNSTALHGLASDILQRHAQNEAVLEETMDVALGKVIRPAIASVKPKQRTASLAALQDHSTERPWHRSGAYLKRMYGWILTTCSPKYASAHWSQLLPFLLNLIDDIDVPSRNTGLLYSAILVDKLSHQILVVNGIGQVIWDAVFPMITILPGAYPEAEVIQVAEPAYTTLLALAAKHDPHKKMALLDKILREGILTDYSHALQFPRLMTLFLRQLTKLIETMGIHAVKHLKCRMRKPGVRRARNKHCCMLGAHSEFVSWRDRKHDLHVLAKS